MLINLIGIVERAVGHNPSLARTGVYGAVSFPRFDGAVVTCSRSGQG
jgi:hypothetical protein